MKVIFPSDQCEAYAAIWHDGQITVAGEKRVKAFYRSNARSNCFRHRSKPKRPQELAIRSGMTERIPSHGPGADLVGQVAEAVKSIETVKGDLR